MPVGGGGGSGAAPPATTPDWGSVEVEGSRVRYGDCGTGPVSLFLHGWGLGPHAYRCPIKAMAASGSRVLAPALPGFAGTAELAREERSFPGYARWLGQFLDAVGVHRLAVVAGHSFGGGVATAFAYEQPWRLSSLLLANAIGSPTWAPYPDEVRTMGQRPIWDWGRHFSADLLRSPALLRVLSGMLGDFIPNLLTNPLGLVRTGDIIRRADLVREVAAVAAFGIPVAAVWSDRDRLVPRSAFDELRKAAGVSGTVVPGPHAWLIADPGAFGDVFISALVDAGVLVGRDPKGSLIGG